MFNCCTDIEDITYTKLSGGFCLFVRQENGSAFKFTGFRDQDLSTIRTYIEKTSKKEVVERPLVVNGQNWGEALLHTTTLAFAPPGTHECTNTTPNAFEVALTDVSAVSAPVIALSLLKLKPLHYDCVIL
eukprot:4543256-Pyramimonas_sp.AAC.1